MSRADEATSGWPPSIANWLGFQSGQPQIVITEFPLFSDARITGEIALGPYVFMNTVPADEGAVQPVIILRYSWHTAGVEFDFRKTDSELYHGGGPADEIAALASLAMGARLRAGNSTRRFEPNGDPLGRPEAGAGASAIPYFRPSGHCVLPLTRGQHSLDSLYPLDCSYRGSQTQARAIVRAARLYQDALWFAESEPELTWLLLVSALEAAANEWRKEDGSAVDRLESSKPDLHQYLIGLEDASILPRVAEHIADSLGSTRKFVDFVLQHLSGPPDLRPPIWEQFEWTDINLKKALRIIYGYRSKALHEGRPFPAPMCVPPYIHASNGAVQERMHSLAVSMKQGIWQQEDIPMNLHLFEYITRKTLLAWLVSFA